jgi:hypothetical protein
MTTALWGTATSLLCDLVVDKQACCGMMAQEDHVKQHQHDSQQ